MRITNLNPDADIGASGWMLEIDGHRLLMDAGIHPKLEGKESLPLFPKVRGQEVDAIAITHCHHDHVGSLPLAMREFPHAHVIMTELSYFLVERVLHNSVNVMKRQREELGIREYPLYTHEELDDLAPRFQGFKYNREIDWAAFRKGRAGFLSPTLEFFDAGHALGSAGVLVRGKKETLFYTGDACFHDQTILKAARFEDVDAEVLIMETTRGARSAAGVTRATEITRLRKAIKEASQGKGAILIPTFALGRTQEILALLALMTAEGELKPQPIHIGGLGRVFTEIYDLEAHRTHRQYPNLQLNEALDLEVIDPKKAQSMRLSKGRIFVITAGMMSEHTAAHDLAARMAGDENQHIFLVGYTDPDTPGGRLRLAKHGETFVFSPSAGRVTRRCHLESFDLTAHADRDEMLDFACQVNPRAVVLGHGDGPARAWFEAQFRARRPKMKVFQPQPGQTIEV